MSPYTLEQQIQNTINEIDRLKVENAELQAENKLLRTAYLLPEDKLLLAEIDRLKHNQMTTDYANLARVTALQTQEADAAVRYANDQQQRAEALDYKCTQFTEALLKGMTLVDELLRENARLCAASGDPPSVRLFAAKASWDTAMHKLLGDAEPTADTTSLTSATEGEAR